MDSVSITLSALGLNIPVNPVFGDDVKMKFSQEDNQMFMRQKIDGTIKFVGSDFDVIESFSDEVEFTLTVSRGSTTLGSGTFIRSDCEFNYDDKLCTVKLAITDRYEKFLNNYDNKYNLVRLAPQINQLTLNRRAVLQIYGMGDTKITNIVGNTFFEQDATAESDDATLRNTYKFTNVGLLSYWEILEDGLLISGFEGAAGRYILASPYSQTNIGTYKQENGEWEIVVTFSQIYTATLQKQDHSGNYAYATFYSLSSGDAGNLYTQGGVKAIALTFYADVWLYARLLLPKTATGASERPSEDICDTDKTNYPYVIPSATANIDIVGRLMPMIDRSSTPTEWGIDGNTLTYFQRPTLSSSQQSEGDDLIPIVRSFWNRAANWLRVDPNLLSQMEAYNDPYTLKDAYPLWSAIKVLLAEVDSSLAYDSTGAFSEFFHSNANTGGAVASSPYMRSLSRLYITPITNIKKTRYEQAAQRGDITLKQILDMLRNVYQCYWFIDANNRLRIEHVSYFKNGNSYNFGVTPTPFYNVPNMKDYPTKLPWSFGTNEVKFDRKQRPSRYEFAWGDECTEQFNGYAIDIEDKEASGDTKEKISVTNFTADIDYTVINPNGVSDDIYALLEATSGYNVQIPNIRLSDTSPIYAMQNGYCSFLFAEAHYWPFDLGGWKAKANGVYLDVVDIRRFAEQSLVHPVTPMSVWSLGLQMLSIKTGLGYGLMKEIEINADTLSAKTKALLEVERDYSDQISIFTVPYAHGTTVWYAQNNSKHALKVQIASFGGTDLTTSTYEMLVGGGVYLGSASSTRPVVVSAKINKDALTVVSEFIRSGVGKMTTLVNSQSSISSLLSFVFYGNSYDGGYDFGFFKVHLPYDCNVTITPNTEGASYDFGYVAKKPIYGTGTTLLRAGGSTAASGLITGGRDLFFGYRKDSSTVSGLDTVYFQIEKAN